ncbi:hypothetical protein BHAP_0072 [Bifidobacterium hapali]|uniref:Pesticidal crystal protein Cry22Aa Ig-like domain-containing protein n=1 Tax=Bifidobacterium hapali TaxID=1630172 RepID=A0A261G628_9BIFI|nr:immunoglobulin-like domain-containing protein [Bifidobacterium hapali]OZG66663.1 hypothetical protein BHAP_0072 [Bifidobacterium hapali]
MRGGWKKGLGIVAATACLLAMMLSGASVANAYETSPNVDPRLSLTLSGDTLTAENVNQLGYTYSSEGLEPGQTASYGIDFAVSPVWADGTPVCWGGMDDDDPTHAYCGKGADFEEDLDYTVAMNPPHETFYYAFNTIEVNIAAGQAPVSGLMPEHMRQVLAAWLNNDAITGVAIHHYVSGGSGGNGIGVGGIAGYEDYLVMFDRPDTQAPKFAGVSDVTLPMGSSFDPLAGVSASDVTDGDVTGNVTVTSNPVDTSNPGVYTVEYSVKDKAGNTATAKRTVTVTTVVPSEGDLTEDTQATGLIAATSVTVGGEVTVNVGADHAGDKADVTMFSTPRVLATGVTVASDGTVKVKVPSDTPAGTHRIAVKLWSDPSKLVWDSVTVKAAAQQPDNNTGSEDNTAGTDTQKPTQPTENNTNTQNPQAKTDTLPQSGAGVMTVVAIMLILAAAAGVTVVIRRRA